MNNARIVLTTAGGREPAERLAEALVQRRLAACVNIVGPIRSIYRWKGNLETEEEFLLLIKTTADKAETLGETFRELHTFELPERIEIKIEGGSEEYLKWISSETSG